MKKLKPKQWIGAALVILGLCALIFSQYIKGQVGEEMGQVRTIIGPLSQTGQGGRMVGQAIEDRASGEAAGYLQGAQFLMVGGIAGIVVGICLFYFGRRK